MLGGGKRSGEAISYRFLAVERLGTGGCLDRRFGCQSGACPWRRSRPRPPDGERL